ncbi:MAG: N-acyl homoserine lactonase family protein, partial [Sphingomicrobium sp.]
MKKLLVAAVAIGLAGVTSAQPAPAPAKVTLTRVDCGSITVSSLDIFSDTFLYPGQSKTLTDSCYLIRHGDKVMIWDTGLSADLVGKPAMASGPFAMSLTQTLVAQLARVGVKPADVDYIGISHYHDDHTGQAVNFPAATLLMGKADFEVAKQYPPAQKGFAPWISGRSKVEPVEGDKDVFGDGRVMILAMPGHTPGHQALLVRLASGPVLLTGDQYHFTEQVKNRGVPSF